MKIYQNLFRFGEHCICISKINTFSIQNFLFIIYFLQNGQNVAHIFISCFAKLRNIRPNFDFVFREIRGKFCEIRNWKFREKFSLSQTPTEASRASCFALVYLKEKVEFILFFNYTKSPDATTFTLSSNSILHHHPPQSPHPYNPTPSSLITHPSSPVLGTNSYCRPLESNF